MCGGGRKGRAALRRSWADIEREQSEQEIAIIRNRQEQVYEPPYQTDPWPRAVYPAKAKPRKAPESAFQCQVAKYLSKALPEGYFYTCFPAGGGGRIRGARLKQMGLVAGLPDLLVFAPDDRSPNVAWIELKAKSGSLSQTQKDIHKRLQALGHEVATCKTLDEIQDIMAQFCFPDKLRARA